MYLPQDIIFPSLPQVFPDSSGVTCDRTVSNLCFHHGIPGVHPNPGLFSTKYCYPGC